MKMKIDLSKFKLKDNDGSIATLRHPDGHEFRVAVAALHPMNRKNLESLERHEEPEVQRFAKGGEVKQSNPKLEESKKTPPKYADGGDVDAEPIEPDEADAQPKEQAPATVNVNAAPQPALPNSPPMAQVQPQITQGNQNLPNAAQSTQAPATDEPKEPETLKGYAQQEKGIQQEAQGEIAQQQAATQALKAQAGAQQELKDQFTTHLKDINDQAQAVRQDILDGHIDPNRYMGRMDTGQRIATGIGLILGGLGGGHGPNQALEFLNRNIDRDIEAQKAEMGKKETILGSLMKQGEDERSATDMTRIIMHDMAATQLQMAAAKSSSTVIQGKAQQMLGALQQQVAPLAQQLAMRKTLTSGGSSLQGQDPATFVPYVVPKEHQSAVFGEIERAQDTRRMTDSIMQSFEQSAKDVNGVINRPLSLVKTPRSSLALHQALQPTFKDLEGTVRQAAMDNTFTNVTPSAGDTANDIQTKRIALQNYLQSKASAPQAKGFGLDLDKFHSTANKPEAKLSSEQQGWVKWARENPSNPKSSLLLKKLGLQ